MLVSCDNKSTQESRKPLSTLSDNNTDNTITASDHLIASFTTFIKSVENETKTLKNITKLNEIINSSHNMPTNSAVNIMDQVRLFESTLLRLENSMEIFEEQIETETNNLKVTKELLVKASKQQEEITHLIHLADDKENTNQPVDHVSSMIPSNLVCDGISETEFQAVSKSTRGRISLKQVIDAYDLLTAYSIEKKKVMSATDKPLLLPSTEYLILSQIIYIDSYDT